MKSRKEPNEVYMMQKDLCAVFGYGQTAVSNRVKEIREYGGDRYKYPFCDRNVHIGVFVDWCANRRMLLDKNARKYVPPFNPYDALAYAGAMVDRQKAGEQDEQ